MATQYRSEQQLYKGRGPLDPKSLVKTFANLIDLNTWTHSNTFVAYNGMITAVWLDKQNPELNGVYLLFDPAADTAIKKPDVTNAENWHKFASLSDLDNIQSNLTQIREDLMLVDERVAKLEEDKVVITRDNEYNYKKKTPIANEICLVDVPGFGIRVKIGDGEKPFTDLTYLDEAVLTTIDNIIVKGYYYQNQFYKDLNHTELLAGITGRIYIDASSSKIYTYDGSSYTSTVVNATPTTAGIMKLYDTLGQNTDGAMTQKAVTDELNQKFEVDFDHDQEMLIFDNDFDDNI